MLPAVDYLIIPDKGDPYLAKQFDIHKNNIHVTISSINYSLRYNYFYLLNYLIHCEFFVFVLNCIYFQDFLKVQLYLMFYCKNFLLKK